MAPNMDLQGCWTILGSFWGLVGCSGKLICLISRYVSLCL